MSVFHFDKINYLYVFDSSITRVLFAPEYILHSQIKGKCYDNQTTIYCRLMRLFIIRL